MKHYCDPQGFKGWLKECREKSKDCFFTSFDGPRKGDTDAVFKQGEVIFISAFQPWIDQYVAHKDISLDIGYGSGAHVLAASSRFRLALGVDIHDEADLVRQELAKRGSLNFALSTGDGWNIPHLETDVDFIHSFVTFSHFINMDVVRSYLAECFRVLKNRGVAVIYFGKLIPSKDPKTSYREEKKDLVGWRDRGDETGVNKYRLKIAMWKMEQVAYNIGFDLLGRTSTFKAKKGVTVYCGQHGVILRKAMR